MKRTVTAKRKRPGIVPCLAALLVGVAATATAGGLNTAVTPHEYALPLTGPDKSVQALAQYLAYNSVDDVYNGSGNRVSGATSTKVYSSIQRLYRLFQFEALPSVGFGWQVFLKEIRSETTVKGTGARVVSQGFGDPTLSAGVYIKPFSGFTLAYIGYLDLPLGLAGVSGDTWGLRNSLGYDYQLGNLNIDGVFQYAAFTQKISATSSSKDIDPGGIFSSDIRVAYRFGGFEPYLGYDFQASEASTNVDSGAVVAASNHEHGFTGGACYKFSPNHKLDLKYEQGFAGRNTSQTRAAQLKYTYVFN